MECPTDDVNNCRLHCGSHGPVAGSHEHEIQNLSPGSSVAVREWMDVLEHRVESGSLEDRVVFGTVHRVHERFHVLVDFK